MGQVKEINIKSAYYFFDDMVIIEDFHSNLLEIDKKSHQDINIYYIGYVTIKKFSYCENINKVNPLYLITHSATGYFKEKNDDQVWSGIRSEVKRLNGEKELFYEKNYARTGVNRLMLTMIYL